MTDHLTRRDFVTAASALAGAALLPAAATAGRAPAGAADGTVVLFQGDSITDAGRDRGAADPNSAGALGSGYPLLAAAAALAAHPDRGLRFYNRGISGNKVPDLAARWGAAIVPLQRVFNDLARRSTPQYWAADGVHPTPAGHAAIAEQWRRAAKL